MAEKNTQTKKLLKRFKRNNIMQGNFRRRACRLGAISIVDQQIAFQIKWFKRGCMAIVEDSAHGKIVSRLCKSMVSLTYLTRASVKSKKGKRLQQFSPTFGEV